jgi:hypothetical protein
LDSFQVAFAPGEPGALPWASAGAAGPRTASPARTAATAAKLAQRSFRPVPAALFPVVAGLAMAVTGCVPRITSSSRRWPGERAVGGLPGRGRMGGFPHNIDFAKTAGQELARK